ncbi:GIY-YIG nuclease family protein [uncultured Sphingomonas sp.]|uniref:GIY-YIG nuclease family protein n=1 Tax=unclassified Sphingomonas TaxID=196159 RepID=UPI0025D560F3|nr:GIY-YIG nuclease family protein [uncultured Sphingomonas sp.]
MLFWVYLLHCSDGSFYAGHTGNLDPRISRHHAARRSDYTARRQPGSLAWSRESSTRLEALETERRIKGWSRAKKEALITGGWDQISRLAASHPARPSTGSGRTGGERPGAARKRARSELLEGRRLKTEHPCP